MGPGHAALHDPAGAGLKKLELHLTELAACTRCPDMGKPVDRRAGRLPVVMGRPVASKVFLVGQAPGDKEPVMGRPFAWTAGKNLFKWFGSLGVDEETFRSRVYMAAVCRCFPGKNPKGGDRVPSPEEIDLCKPWLERELELLRPELIIPVGKLAIAQFLDEAPLAELIGRTHPITRGRRAIDVIPLPHPSGASTWYHVEPGKRLTRTALDLIGAHPAWLGLAE